MEKIKLFLDMDATIVDSTQAFCKAYDEIHKTNTDYTIVENYDFSPVLKLSQQEITDIFADEKFFHNLKFFDGVERVLKKFENWYSYIIVTIGSPKNIFLKQLWLQEHSTFDIKTFCGINNFNRNRKDPERMNKSIIDMGGAGVIFIDDHYKNLESSSSKTKILFRDNPNHSWSKPTEDTKHIITNWTDGKIEEILYNNIYGM